jgi:hypothetical protein
MIYLKQSTASQEVILGPFVDSTDAVTAETGLTIANTDIKIYKAGTTTSANKNSGGATHDAGGRYSIVLDATDTNTLGSGQIHVSVAGALPVKIEFCVLAANVYDALIGGGDLLQVDTNEITGTAALSVGVLDAGTAQSATSTTIVLRAAAAFADDALIGATVIQTGGTNSPQAARITDNVLTGDTVTVAAWPNGTPGGTITYVIIGTTPDSAGGGLDAAGTRAALGMSAANLDSQIATLATAAALATVDTVVDAILVDTDATIPALITTVDTVVDSIQVDTNDIQARLPAALVSGRIDASVGAMAAGVVTAAAVATGAIDADAIATDAVTEIQSGLATTAAVSAVSALVTTVDAVVDAILQDTGTDIPALIATVDARLDTEIPAIKAQTDKLTFNGRNEVSADVKAVINDPVVGGSTKTTAWGGTA